MCAPPYFPKFLGDCYKTCHILLPSSTWRWKPPRIHDEEIVGNFVYVCLLSSFFCKTCMYTKRRLSKKKTQARAMSRMPSNDVNHDCVNWFWNSCCYPRPYSSRRRPAYYLLYHLVLVLVNILKSLSILVYVHKKYQCMLLLLCLILTRILYHNSSCLLSGHLVYSRWVNENNKPKKTN